MLRDLQPVTKLAGGQYVLVLHPSVPAATLKEFIALAKAQPGKLNYSSAGIGSPLHLAAEMFKLRAGMNIVHVPYKGGGPAAAAGLAGEVQVVFGSVPATLPQVKAGRLRALAVTGPQALAGDGGRADTRRVGLRRFQRDLVVRASAAGQNAAPGGDAALRRSVARAEDSPTCSEALARQGLDIETSASPEAFAAELKAETAAWAQVIQTAGIKAD